MQIVKEWVNFARVENGTGIADELSVTRFKTLDKLFLTTSVGVQS